MKSTRLIRLSLAIFAPIFISSCARETVDHSDRSVIINATIGTDDTTKAFMDPDRESFNYIAKWHGTERLSILYYDSEEYNITTTEAQIKDLQSDGRGASFSYSIPKEWGLKGDVSYTHACFTKAAYPTPDGNNKKLYLSASIIRQPLKDFELPLYYIGDTNNGQSYATFHHYYTYEILHVRNTSNEKIEFRLNGFESDAVWYKETASFCVDDGSNVSALKTEKNPVNISAPVDIPAQGVEDIVSAYIPTGHKISNAVMVADIKGNTVHSSNTKSSNVELKTGHAYHMYAEWDGKELKFVEPFTYTAISVSTTSLEFGEVKVGESKTLSFDITNNTSEQISIGDIWSEDTNFFVDWMAGTIGPKETQTVNVTFTPDRAYSVSGAFTVGNEKESYTVTYTAEGVGADVNAEYVDLGLSVKWATCNLGATKPEEYGLYYQWGDTQGYGSDTNDGKYFDWSTYKWCDGSRYTLTKYNTDKSYGIVDNMVTLMPDDDAARAALSSKWRMPSNVEWEELLNNCTLTWTTVNGVNGYKLQSKVPGYADSWIFLPAAGARSQDNLVYVGDNGYYYSSSIALYLPYGMSFLFFSSSSLGANMAVRSNGMSIRPVYAETETSTVSVTTTDIDFGDVKVGTSVSKSLKITNTGSKATNVSISESYGIATSDFSGVATLAAGESKTITLTCSPNEIGSFNGGIDIIAGNWCQITYKGNAVESTDSGDPLTFTSTGSTSIAIFGNVPVSVEYNLNGTGWETYTLEQIISLSDKSKVSFRAGTGGNTSFDGVHFSMGGPGKIAASGNIMSLLDADCSLTTIPSSYCFRKLFKDCKYLTTAPKLPATTLAEYCYYYMFDNCTSLTTAPELPATTLAPSCYAFMFGGCFSLASAPKLPATTLTTGCYGGMFFWCTRLVNAPELPATTLAERCYYSMFEGCTSLTTAPEELPAATLTERCCWEMFNGCTSLTNAPKLPATTLANECYYHMFEGCKSLTTAPELPATTLAPNCYDCMFEGCRSLTTAPKLPATTLATDCYYNMFNGCTSLTTAPELPATTLAAYCYAYMFEGCTSLNFVSMMATDISKFGCLLSWMSQVSSEGTFVKNPAATWTHSDLGIPSGWTIIDAE